MALVATAKPETAQTVSDLEATAVREQLKRLLAHSLFANSKRYPVFLAHVVEQTLRGNTAELKERNIGIDAFRLSRSFDPNVHPMVRVTAGEVRKRLSHYYHDSAHDGEWAIELPLGSYVPTFRSPQLDVTSLAAAPELPTHSSLAESVSRLQAVARRRRWLIPGLVVTAALAGLGVGLWFHELQPPTAMDRFWAPMTAGPATVTYCLGEPAKLVDEESIHSLDAPKVSSKPVPLYFNLHYSGLLALADVVTLTRTTAALEARHKAFRVEPASEVSFAQLREGPSVLIAGFDNIWTLRITQGLRFGFEYRNGVAEIVDRKSGKQASWAEDWSVPYEKRSSDYAIVARIHDSVTGQPVIIAAGISEEGTESAGEILYNPVYLDSLLKKAPSNWEHMNMEAVIETQVIEGHQGPPRVLTVESW
ncbi:MAG: hypothetical protein ABSD72_08170 [Terracidiphilus sp.]|jgi:hypothetical protein